MSSLYYNAIQDKLTTHFYPSKSIQIVQLYVDVKNYFLEVAYLRLDFTMSQDSGKFLEHHTQATNELGMSIMMAT